MKKEPKIIISIGSKDNPASVEDINQFRKLLVLPSRVKWWYFFVGFVLGTIIDFVFIFG